MTTDLFMDSLEADSAWLAGEAATANPTLAVPACPGLRLGELVRHVGTVYQLVATWLEEGRRPLLAPRPGTGRSDGQWLAEGRDRLLAALGGLDPSQPASTWSAADRTAGFWRRRMAHESAVHRVDAEAARSLPSRPVAAALATDGTAEVLALWLGTRLGTGVGGDGRLVRLDDGRARWHVALHEHVVEFAPDGAVPAVSVAASPDVLYRWLWGRAPLEAVEVDGDVRLAVELRTALARATQ